MYAYMNLHMLFSKCSFLPSYKDLTLLKTENLEFLLISYSKCINSTMRLRYIVHHHQYFMLTKRAIV